jgi:branched-chain amino acid transport system substrate-binding protein
MGIKTFLRRVAVIACAALLPAVASAADAPSTPDTQGITKDSITIGELGPFSGPESVFTPLNYGAVAYLRYINAQAGIYGRKFKIEFADSACNEATGIAAAKKLVFSDKVFMIMSNPCSGVAMAIKPMLLQAGIPWMGASANPKITTPPAPGLFATTYTGKASGEAMAAFAMSKPGVTKVAIIEHSNDWAHGYCDPATAYVKSDGGTIVTVATMESGATDATPQVLQIKASGAQAVMACLYQPELIVFLRQMQNFSVDAVTLAALGADYDQVLTAIPNHSYLEQHFFQPYQFRARIGTAPLQQFHDIFVKYLTKSELPKDGVPTNFYYFGVPNAIVATEAFRLAGPNPTRTSWEKAVESLKNFNTGVLADTETFSPTNHVGVSKMYAVGLSPAGKETVYESWNKPLPDQQ